MTLLSDLYGAGSGGGGGFSTCVIARVDTKDDDVTGDGTYYNLTGSSWTEIEDNNNDFSNGTFTAPATGVYQISGVIGLSGITSSHTLGQIIVGIAGSTYAPWNFNPYSMVTGIMLNVPFSYSYNMDADDTCTVRVKLSGGTKVVDIRTDTTFFVSRLL